MEMAAEELGARRKRWATLYCGVDFFAKRSAYVFLSGKTKK
jgi:hypothetical protein